MKHQQRRDFPAGQELAVVSARVGQADAQPDHRNQGLDDERGRQPANQVVQAGGAQAKAREEAVDANRPKDGSGQGLTARQLGQQDRGPIGENQPD
jgi:hypothetical protein